MEYQASLQSVKNEIIMELRNENQSVVEKLNIAQRYIDAQNLTIISLSEELKTIKKEMCIYAKQKQHIDSILETVQSIDLTNLIDSSNNNDVYTSNTLINNENDFENTENTIIQETLMKTEIQDEIEEDFTIDGLNYPTLDSTINENDDNSYYNNNINMSGTLTFREDLLDNVTNKLLVINKEITIKTEIDNQFEENINESLEKESNDRETIIIGIQGNSMDSYSNVSTSQFDLTSIESSNPQSSNLNTRISVISEKIPFKCDLCMKTFTNTSNLINHLRTHTGEKPFRCDICERRFARYDTLNIHLRTHTGGEKPFRCDICERRFARYDTLNVHLRTHTGERPYKCDICAKKFARNDNLQIHLSVHTGEKPFDCNKCLKRFTQSSSLHRHLRTHAVNSDESIVNVNSDIKLFKCDLCPKRFTTSSNLVNHIRVHTGEKPFECMQCPQRFTQYGSLKRHLRIHTDE